MYSPLSPISHEGLGPAVDHGYAQSTEEGWEAGLRWGTRPLRRRRVESHGLDHLVTP